MNLHPVSRRVDELFRHEGRLFDMVTQTSAAFPPGVSNFLVGNPQEEPDPALVEALREAALPRRKDWFAYAANDASAQRTIAEGLTARFGQVFEPEDVCFTCGSFGGLAVCLQTLLDSGDEVIINEPGWPFYSMLVRHAGGTPVEVDLHYGRWDLDLEAIERAITPHTRVVVVNSPHNPTGRIYDPDALERLAQLLERASERYGRRVYLLSDESYSRIVFDGRPFVSPTSFYPSSLLVYTYGKILLAPGLRVGYVALPVSMPGREQVRRGITMVQIASGWAFPVCLLQYAVEAFERQSIDMDALQSKRDRMVSALREIGYQVYIPEGTFYLFPRAPGGDAAVFAEILRMYGILVVPGWDRFRGWFRISLTATDEMVERSVDGFRAAFEQVRTHDRQREPLLRSHSRKRRLVRR
jgi:aspartate aminotransferase